jgi:hypothetical protein
VRLVGYLKRSALSMSGTIYPMMQQKQPRRPDLLTESILKYF